MIEQPTSPILLSIDVKKYRIRVHKSTLHQLGDPSDILLLVNPSTRVVAVKSVDRRTSLNLSHRVPKKKLLSDKSIEIYSKSFIDLLNKLVPGLNDGFCYHMTGNVVPSEQLALFDFNTLCPFPEGDSTCQ